MASGWLPDGATQAQIDADIKDAIDLARSRLPSGESRIHCDECEALIPEGRRNAIPGVRLCITCQTQRELTER